MRTCVFGSVALMLLSAAVFAQGVLSEEDALARLASDNPRTRAVRAPIAVAEAEARLAQRWPNPRVSVQREAVSGVTEVLSTVQQSLPITGRRRLEYAELSELTSAVTARAGEAMRAARADVRRAYAALALTQARDRALRDARARLQALADHLAVREAAGDTAAYDRLRVEREIIDLDADRRSVAADRTRAAGELASLLLGTLDPSTLVVADLPTSGPPLPDVAALVAHADRTRGDLLALEHERASAALAARVADRRRIPEPELIAGTKSASPSVGGSLGSVIAVQATVSLFDKGRADRALADARGRSAVLHADALRQEMRADIVSLHATVLARRDAAASYRAVATKSTDEVERIARVSYDAGERGIFDLVDAHRTAGTARLRQLALDAAVRFAEIDLEFVTGWELK